MKSKIKWWVNSLAAFAFVLVAVVYLLIRPIVVQNIAPVITDAADNKINGTVTWSKLDLDPNYDLEFMDLQLQDGNGVVVLSAPSLTVGWTLSSMYDYVMKGTGIASVVKTVTLEDPNVYLNQKADGTWNVQSLLKSAENEDSGNFTGEVIITGKKAQAHVITSQAGTFDFSRLSGNFRWDDSQAIEGQLEGNFLDSAFAGTLHYINTDRFNIQVKTNEISLKSLQPLMGQFPQFSQSVDLKEGTGEVTSAKIWKSDGKVAYKVDGRLDHAALGYENDVLADGAAFFCIENDRITVRDFKGKINDQTVEGEGTVEFDTSDPVISGTISLKKVDAKQLLKNSAYSDVEGIFDGRFFVSGTLAHPEISGELAVERGEYKGISIARGSANFSCKENAVQIFYLEADAADGHILGKGRYDINSGLFSADGSFEKINTEQIPLDEEIHGIISGNIRAEGKYKGNQVECSYASGDLRAQDLQYQNISAGFINGFGIYEQGKWNFTANGRQLSYTGIPLDTMSISAYGNETDDIHVSYMTGTSGEGAFTARGSLQNHQLDFYVKGTDWDISPFAGLVGENISGIVSGEAQIKGSEENPEGHLQFAFRDGLLRNIAIDFGEGSASLQNRMLSLHSVKIWNSEGMHSLSGNIGLDAPHALSLKIRTEKARIENLMKLAGLSYPVTGWIENELTVGGSLDKPVLSGDFRAWSGSVMGQLFQNISGMYSYQDNEIELKNVLGYIYEGVAVVNGTVKQDHLDLAVSLTDINIERMLPDKGIQGIVSLSGNLNGTVQDPDFTGQAFSREIVIGGNKVNTASAGIRYKSHMLSVEDGTFRQKSGRFNWRGSYNTESGHIQGNLQFSHWNIVNIFQLFKLPGKEVDGEVEGGMRISGTLDDPNVDFKAVISSGHLGSVPMGEGTIDFSYLNKALMIRKMYIPVGNGSFAVQGAMNSAGDLDIQAAAKDMDISWIPSVLGKEDIFVGGQLTALVQLSGNRNMPKAQTSVELLQPRYGEVVFDRMLMMATAENNVIHIQNSMISRNAYKATLKGTLPGNVITGSETDKAVPLDLDVDLEHADMNIFALLFKEITSAEGPIKGHLKIGGSYKNPYLLGGIAVNDGMMTLTGMNEPISSVQLKMDFSGYTADVSGRAQLGGGEINTQGTASWEQLPQYDYKGELHIHAPSINSAYYKGALDGDFTLDQLSDRMGVSGNLHIHDAIIDIPLDMLGDSEGNLPDLLTKIDIQIGDNVRLYNSTLYDMMLKGNISVLGPMQSAILSGRVSVLKGIVKVSATEFKIDQASATWNSLPGNFYPTVHAKAAAKIGHYNITTEMDGVPGNMTTRFYSDPPLSDTQILLLLTIHQDPEKDSSGAAEGALFNAGLTMVLGSGIQDFLQDKIGLDLVNITSNLTDYYSSSATENDNYYYIKIGKYLFNDFMLTATMGMNNDDKSIGIHYDLNSHLGLSSWYNNMHDSYVGTDWSFKF